MGALLIRFMLITVLGPTAVSSSRAIVGITELTGAATAHGNATVSREDGHFHPGTTSAVGKSAIFASQDQSQPAE